MRRSAARHFPPMAPEHLIYRLFPTQASSEVFHDFVKEIISIEDIIDFTSPPKKRATLGGNKRGVLEKKSHVVSVHQQRSFAK